MNVLYNGEYTDFDITTIYNWKDLLSKQEKFYPQWVGKKYGDFEIVKIEWDWGLSYQRALLRCAHCGFEKHTNDLRSFRRGKGTTWRCKCQKKTRIKKAKKEVVRYADFVGEEINGFVSLKYVPNKNKGMRVCCVECMKEKWASGKDFVSGNITCNHKEKNIYDENLVGTKFGDLTVLEKRGGVYLCRCECGFEKELPAYRFVNGSAKTCGRPECEYYIRRNGKNVALKRRAKGLEFEHKLQDIFEQAGYDVTRTPDSGDYGVDFIVNINGERWAFQCKKHTRPAGTRSIFEVYAGGRFYDCARFCVASPSGFTTQAMKCAAKLGVQLETEKFRFNVSQNENTVELLKTAESVVRVGSKAKGHTINGSTKSFAEWCKQYNFSQGKVRYRMSLGMSLEEALHYIPPKRGTKIEINGKTKTKVEWCNEYGISTSLYDYRTKNNKMTPYEALTTPKQAM